jgi:drug/metabolite transporter (DMT)-like permease
VSRSLKAHILLVLVTLVWGATFVVIKNALADMSPLLFNAVRMVLASVSLWIIFHKDMRSLTRPALQAGALVGAFLWLGYEFQTTGLRLTSASKSAFLTGSSVVIVPIILAVALRRHINRWTTIGFISAFVGLYLMTVPVGAPGEGWASINRGDLLTLACAIAFALHIILLGRAAQKHAFQQIAVLQVTVCALLMVVAAPVLEHTHVIWSARVVWAILITGLLGTAVAFSVQAWAQQFLPPTHTVLVFSLEPVFAWLTSMVVLGERLGLRALTGAALIMAGVLVSELMGGGEAEIRELQEETR